MTNADGIKAHYRQVCQETIIVRRYTGSGTSRPKFDVPVRGRAIGYDAKELIGGIVQGDQKVIVLVEDLIAKGMTLPLTTSDKAVVNGKEIAIMAPTPRKALDGTLVAYELQCRG